MGDRTLKNDRRPGARPDADWIREVKRDITTRLRAG